ncbi:MAG: ABC transporter permease [Verrucomicrobiota bacterium]|nr:ABC transporter permease [Verrucomicrobiota bacterium]
MKAIVSLLRKDYALFFSDRAAVFLTFFVPMALIWIFGTIFGRGGDGGPVTLPFGLVDTAKTATSKAICEALAGEKGFKLVQTTTDTKGIEHPLDEKTLRAMMEDNKVRFALIIYPEKDTGKLLDVRLKYLNNPRNEIETQVAEGLLQKTLFTRTPQLLIAALSQQSKSTLGPTRNAAFTQQLSKVVSQNFGPSEESVKALLDDPAGYIEKQGGVEKVFGLTTEDTKNGTGTKTGGGTGDIFGRLLNLEREQVAGQTVKNPWIARSVGGWAMMFLLFSLSAAATSLFEEKKAGLYLRLLAAPVTPSQILLSKYIYCMSLGFIQLLTLFIGGWLIFKLDIWTALPDLVVVCLFASAASTAFGMVLAAFCTSQGQASGLATLLILTMSAVGGAMFPTSFMPDFIQQIAHASIVYWAMEGIMGVLWAGKSFWELWLELLALGLFAVGALSLANWQFRRGSIFR